MPLSHFFALLVVVGASQPVAALDEAECEEGRERFVEMLDEQRVQELQRINNLLAEASAESELEHLRAQREEVWDLDERLRATAEQIWRDCLQHVRASK